MDAVTKSVHGLHTPLPFVIFGPPGTGKTVTMVEAVRHVAREEGSHVLVCTPSNDAADLYITRLAGVFASHEMLRLNAPSRDPRDLDPVTAKYSRWSPQGSFAFPADDELKRFRIVVATCVTGGTPYELGVAQDHFSHVFVDEAGQAIDYELQVSVARHTGPSTSVVLAGDHQQLGVCAVLKTACAWLTDTHTHTHTHMHKAPPFARRCARPCI